MKGLLVKDLKLVKNQGRLLIFLAIAMGAIFGIMDANPTFVVSYMTIFFTIFTISTISYDEYDNGFAFLLTLPATRQQYVHEKYIFSLIMMGGAWAGGMAVSILLGLVWHPQGGLSVVYETSWIFIILGAIMVSVLVPLKLKFEGEKGRLVIPVVCLGGVLIFFLAFKYIDILPEVFAEKVFSIANELGTAGIAVVIAAVTVAIFAVSWLCSLHIMKRREF